MLLNYMGNINETAISQLKQIAEEQDLTSRESIAEDDGVPPHPCSPTAKDSWEKYMLIIYLFYMIN